MNNRKLIIAVGSLILLLNGCGSSVVQPKIDKKIKKIKAPSVRKTDYDSFLRNIGKMYRVYYSANNIIPFQSKPITNDTGTGGLPVDVSKMVITSVSKIGKPIVYIPYDPNYLINELNTGGAINRVMPKYVISGAITEYDKGVMRESDGAGVDFFVPFSGGSGADGSASKDNSTTASRIVMDFFLIDYATQSMVSGVQSTKTITVYEQSKSQDVGFHIFGSGFGVNGSVSRKQGVHAALRLLIELSIAEILAKEAGLPYWKLSKDLKPDQGTIDKVFYDMDGLNDETKIVLMKEYLTKYGFRINDIENPVLDAQTTSFYEVLKQDLKLGDLGNGYITTDDLVTLHFNIPFKKDDKKYNNSMAKSVPTPIIQVNTQATTTPLEHLLSNIDKLSSITTSVYIGSIVDANDMYKTPFSENLENQIKTHLQQNSTLSLNERPIDIKQKTRSFKKRKKISPNATQEVVEVVGYVDTTNKGTEVELQVLSKEGQRLRVIKEFFTKVQSATSKNVSAQKAPISSSLDTMREIAQSSTEMKTDDIFFMTDKGDTHQIYTDGEKIEFALGVRENSYAYIFDIDSNLEINTLFDSTIDTSSKQLTPDELYIVPSPDADFEIIASAPYGAELIKVIVSTVPLNIPEVKKDTRSFKKSSKSNAVAPEEFINNLRNQAKSKGATMYEKTIIVETRVK